ncbi:MAG: hypothetical protein H6R16_1005 [Proteobacteria bacterium]|nr:hypothetical protein [Pseudomonadota bacterium]
MLAILKVIGRVFLISIGLLCIAGGGLCVVLGSTSGEVGGIAAIGLVSLLLGAAGVWWILRSWMGERREKEGEDVR